MASICSRATSTLLLALAALAAAGPTKLPPEFKVCKRDGNFIPCIDEALVGALQVLAHGIPDFGIPPLDPLVLPLIELGDDNKNAPVNLHINLTDILIHNLKSAKPSKTSINLEKHQMATHGHIPTIFAESNYVMDGRVLLLPAKGEGRSTLNITNLEADITIVGEKLIKKNKEYFKITNVECHIEHVDSFIMHFDNLFNGDKALGESMNNLMNENWQDMWLLLKVPLEQTLQYTFQEFARRIFDKVPVNEIFLPNDK